MRRDERPQTDYIGHEVNFTTPPDAEGWQVTYDLGIQGQQLVLIGVHLRSVVAEVERTLPASAKAGRSLPGSMRTIPAGGLSAERVRSLIKPGAAMREFLAAAFEDRLSWPASRSEIEKAIQAGNKGRAWQAKPTPEYLDFVAWLKTLPAMRRIVHRGPIAMLPRKQRIAWTSAEYVRAAAMRHPAPRRRVAELQGRDEAAVRDDLHAARVEHPVLLVGGGVGKVGGQPTAELNRIIEEMQAGSVKKPRTSSAKGSTKGGGKR